MKSLGFMPIFLFLFHFLLPNVFSKNLTTTDIVDTIANSENFQLNINYYGVGKNKTKKKRIKLFLYFFLSFSDFLFLNKERE